MNRKFEIWYFGQCVFGVYAGDRQHAYEIARAQLDQEGRRAGMIGVVDLTFVFGLCLGVR